MSKFLGREIPAKDHCLGQSLKLAILHQNCAKAVRYTRHLGIGYHVKSQSEQQSVSLTAAVSLKAKKKGLIMN